MTRLLLLELDDIPEENHLLFTDDYLGDRHIFRVWAHDSEVLEGTLEYLNVLYDQFLSPIDELVILTVARARGARYEWHRSVDIVRDKGAPIEEMQAIRGDGFSVFDDAEYVLLQYARAVESGNVTDQIHDALTREYSPLEIISLGLLVNFYVGLCNDIAAANRPSEGANSLVRFLKNRRFRGLRAGSMVREVYYKHNDAVIGGRNPQIFTVRDINSTIHSISQL